MSLGIVVERPFRCFEQKISSSTRSTISKASLHFSNGSRPSIFLELFIFVFVFGFFFYFFKEITRMALLINFDNIDGIAIGASGGISVNLAGFYAVSRIHSFIQSIQAKSQNIELIVRNQINFSSRGSFAG